MTNAIDYRKFQPPLQIAATSLTIAGQDEQNEELWSFGLYGEIENTQVKKLVVGT